MDLEDIRDLPTVVARLAAMGPSKVRGPHCWFCGKIEAWFQCDCAEARDAQQGKRAKPRFDVKRGVMILDEEIIERNLAWGFARRYVAPAPTPANVDTVDSKKRPAVSTVDKNVDTVDSGVDKSASSVDSVDKAAARRAYKAENERQRRARGKQEP